MSEHFDVPGLEFYDEASHRFMKYVYPDTKHRTSGWILYKHPDGQWVTEREATLDDVKALNQAVTEEHHKDSGRMIVTVLCNFETGERERREEED